MENKTKKNNVMKQVRIEKLTLNIGAGKEQSVLEKGMKLLKNITGIPAVKTFSKKRIPEWGLRPGLPIGCKITLRKKDAENMLKRLLEAKSNTLRESQFDSNGNIAFGIHEYIDIPDVKYDPQIGMMGLEVCVTLQRPGYRIKNRAIQKRKIPPKQRITQKEAMSFMINNFNVKIGEEA